jgi:hypothetical protein
VRRCVFEKIAQNVPTHFSKLFHNLYLVQSNPKIGAISLFEDDLHKVNNLVTLDPAEE